LAQLATQEVTQHHAAVLAENDILRKQVVEFQEQVSQLKHQLDWFKRQLFGSKSEKRLDIDNSHQADLLASLGITSPPPEETPTEQITYQRRKKQRDANTVNDTGLRFDDSVPVETIDVPNPALADIPADDLEQIGEKISYRLAQRPGSYVILKYVRKVLKRRETQTLHTALMPANVLEKSIADVSFLAGMLGQTSFYTICRCIGNINACSTAASP